LVFDIDSDEPIEISLKDGGIMVFEVFSPPAFIVPL